MVYAYTYENTKIISADKQKKEIESWCMKWSTRIDRWIDGNDSSHIFSDMKKDDIVVVSDFSRLGNSSSVAVNILKFLLSQGVSVFSVSSGMSLNPSKISVDAVDLIEKALYEIDYNLSSEITKNGILKARKNGVKIGRQSGQLPKNIKLTGHEEEIRNAIANGETKASLARRYGVTWVTMNDFIKRRL